MVDFASEVHPKVIYAHVGLVGPVSPHDIPTTRWGVCPRSCWSALAVVVVKGPLDGPVPR